MMLLLFGSVEGVRQVSSSFLFLIFHIITASVHREAGMGHRGGGGSSKCHVLTVMGSSALTPMLPTSHCAPFDLHGRVMANHCLTCW